MKKEGKYRLAGAAAGLVNGLFGGGGGMLLFPLLSRWAGLEERKAFASCVGIILPACAVSAAVCFFQGRLPLLQALPYLLGGALGGAVGGALYRKVPLLWLRRIFALFLLYGAARYLF